jgi:hypothetical protein
MSLMAAAIVNLALPSAWEPAERRVGDRIVRQRTGERNAQTGRFCISGQRLGRRRPVPAAPRRSRRRGTPRPCCTPGQPRLNDPCRYQPAAGLPAPHPGRRDFELAPPDPGQTVLSAGGRHVGPARSPDLRRTCSLWRGPLYDADHHGDFIVVIDAHPGMSVVWGAPGAQVRDMLLKLGQGRAVSKGLLNLACVFVLGSHGHHLRA